MIPSHSSPSSHYDDGYQPQNTNVHDPVDEFLSQLLFDTPHGPSTPTSAPEHLSPPAPALAPTLALSPAPTPLPYLACQWVSQLDPLHICGASLPHDPKRACAHFRLAHDVRGNEKVIVGCPWYACRATPMQRGSLVRHVLTVHLGLLRWQCEGCGKVFSRKGTSHACGADGASV